MNAGPRSAGAWAGPASAWRPLLNWRYFAVSSLAFAAIAVTLAIPTEIIENPLFSRMTPVEPEQYVFWILTSLLGGALVGTYLVPALRSGLAGPTAGSGLLGLFAVGCPICNKLVVGLLGTSGALNLFGPIQPLIGAAAVALAGWALWIRLKLLRDGCPVPQPSGA